jgi:hypothetical protein
VVFGHVAPPRGGWRGGTDPGSRVFRGRIADLGQLAGFTRLPETARHASGALVLHAQRSHEPLAVDPLLVAAHQVDGPEPFAQRDVAALEHRADHNGELAPAPAAAAQADPAALDRGDALRAATPRADRPVGPEGPLKLRERGCLVVEVRGGEAGQCLAPWRGSHGSRRVSQLPRASYRNPACFPTTQSILSEPGVFPNYPQHPVRTGVFPNPRRPAGPAGPGLPGGGGGTPPLQGWPRWPRAPHHGTAPLPAR